MLARVEEVTGRRWLEAVGKELHFSECTLYGVYADEVEQGRRPDHHRRLAVPHLLGQRSRSPSMVPRR